MGRRQLILLALFAGALCAQPPQLTSWYCGGSPTAGFSTVALSGTITCQQTMTASPDVQAYFDNFGNVTGLTAGATSETVTPTATAYYSIKMQSNTLGWGTFSTAAANGNLVPNFAAISANLAYGNIYQWPIFYGPGTLAISVTQNTTTPAANGQPAVVTVTMSTAGCTAFWQGGSACSSVTNPYETAIGRLICVGAGGRTEWVDAVFSPQMSGANKWDFNFTWPIAESVGCSGAIGFGSNYSLISTQTFTFTANGGSNWSPHLAIDSSQPFLFQEVGTSKPWFAVQALPISVNFTSPLQWNEPAYAEDSLASPWMKWGESSNTGINMMGLTEPNPPGDYTFWQGCINTHNPNSSWLGTCHGAEAGPLPGIGTNQAALSTFNTTGNPLEVAAQALRDFKQAGLHTHYELVRQCNISGAYALIGTTTSNNCNPNDQDASTIAFVNALRIFGDRLRPYLDVIKLGSFNPSGFVGPGIQFYWFAPALARQWPFLVSSEPAPVCPSGCLFSSGNGQQDVGAPYGQYSAVAANPSLTLPGDLDTYYNSVANSTHVLYTNTLMPTITSESGNFYPIADADHCQGNGSCNERFPIYLWWNQLAWNIGAGYSGGSNQCLNTPPSNPGAETNSCVGGAQERVQASHYQNHMNDLGLTVSPISFGTSAPCAGHTWKVAGYSSSRDVVVWVFDASARTTCAGTIRFNVPSAMTGYWFDQNGAVISGITLSSGVQNVSVSGLGTSRGQVILRLRTTALPTQPLITMTDLPQAIAGTAYPTTTLTCAGGSGSGYTFAITYGNLPPGLSMTSAGVISGTPTNGIVDNFTVGIDCIDGSNNHSTQSNGTGRQNYLFVVRPKINFPQGTINYYVRTSVGTTNNGPSIDGGAVGVGCNITGTFANTGLTPSNNMCGFTGTTSASLSSDTVTLTATDGAGATATTTMTVIPVAAPAVNPNGPGDFPGGQLVQVCTQNVYCRTAAMAVFSTGTIGSRTWTLTGLPSGLTYATQNPNIAGTTSAAPSNYGVAYSFTDSSGTSNTYNGFITINPPVSISTSSIPAGTINTPYSTCPSFSGGTYPNALLGYTSTLPAGFFIAPRSGCIYGTTATAGTYPFNYQVIDRYGSQQTVALSLVINSSGSVPNPLDTIIITNNTGSTQTNVPIGAIVVDTTNTSIGNGQIGRQFADNEFCGANYPQAFFDSTTLLTTQVNVKKRYNDGCIKFAILSALLPAINNGTSHTITFAIQTTCNCTALSTATMISATYNFDARINLTNGSTITADALTQLTAGNYTNWAPGSVANTVLIASDDQAELCNSHACSLYDFGFDSNKSLRPRFYATFYPATALMYVMMVTESANSETLQDQAYSISLDVGTAHTVVYTHATLANTTGTPQTAVHSANARWAKGAWFNSSGVVSDPPDTNWNVDYNFAYLISTNEFPNWDVATNPLTSARKTTLATNFSSADKDIFSANTTGGFSGDWDTQFGAGGGAQWGIGPFHDGISNMAAAQGDYRMRDQMMIDSLLIANAPLHYREGSTTRILNRHDTAGSGTGKGLPFSLFGRTGYLMSPDGLLDCLGSISDCPTAVGTVTTHVWTYNYAHLPEIGCGEYKITGDFFQLEECEFTTSTELLSHPFGDNKLRQHTPPISVGNEQILRAYGWLIRSEVELIDALPDGDPQITLYESTLQDQLCFSEGVRGLNTDSLCQSGDGLTAYNHGVTSLPSLNGSDVNATIYVMPPSNTFPPMRQWIVGAFNPSPVENCNVSIICTAGAGTITVSGGNVTFSNGAACSALQVGQIIFDSNTASAQILSVASCPTVPFQNVNSSISTSATWSHTNAVNAISFFMQGYTMYSLGRCVELGFDCATMQAWGAPLTINLTTQAGNIPYLIADESLVTTDINIAGTSLWGGYTTTYAQIQADTPTLTQASCISAGTDGFCAVWQSAASYMTNLTGGSNAWTLWYAPNIAAVLPYNTQIKWDLRPRGNAPVITGAAVSKAGPQTFNGPITFQ